MPCSFPEWFDLTQTGPSPPSFHPQLRDLEGSTPSNKTLPSSCNSHLP